MFCSPLLLISWIIAQYLILSSLLSHLLIGRNTSHIRISASNHNNYDDFNKDNYHYLDNHNSHYRGNNNNINDDNNDNDILIIIMILIVYYNGIIFIML
jgi:hypothetical protein